MPVIPAIQVLTPAVFVQKWLQKFAYNDWSLIDDASFREFTQDVAATFGGVVPAVPAYLAGTDYVLSDLVRDTLPGDQESFFYALQAGKLPAPTGLVTDLNWKVVPGPVAATVLWQPVALAAAQNIEGSSVVAGRLYQLDFGPNAAGLSQHVYVRGLDRYFDVVGTLEVNGVRTPVSVNVAAGTFAPLATGSTGGSGGGAALLASPTATSRQVLLSSALAGRPLTDFVFIRASGVNPLLSLPALFVADTRPQRRGGPRRGLPGAGAGPGPRRQPPRGPVPAPG